MKNKDFDSALYSALGSVCADRAAAFEGAPAVTVTHRQDYAENIAAILEKKTPKRLRTPLFFVKRAAVLLSVLLVFTFVIAIPIIPGMIEDLFSKEVTVAQYRIELSEPYGEGLIDVRFVTDQKDIVRPEFELKSINYLPEGYNWRKFKTGMDEEGLIEWTKENEIYEERYYYSNDSNDPAGMAMLMQGFAGVGVIGVESWRATITECKIGDYPAVIITDKDSNNNPTVYFTDGVYEYYVLATINDLDEVMKMVESIETYQNEK